MSGSIYRGTSLWLWVVEGIIAVFVIAFVIAIGYVLLLVAAFLFIAGVLAFLVFWAAAEVKDRLDPPVDGMVEWQVRRELYGNPGPPWRHRLPTTKED
jgi:hypothetical protein